MEKAAAKISQPAERGKACAFPQALSTLLNIDEEKGEMRDALVDIATAREAALLALIAPYRSARVSPVQAREPFVGFPEEYGIEHAIVQILDGGIAKKRKKRLLMLVNSPGGLASSSYKIGKALREHFDDITAFVPHIAASGATLVVLAANRIVMGMMSQLTPIDAQVAYGEERVSAYAMMRALSRLSAFFQTLRPEEAPYPWRAMADKLDPVLMEDWTASLVEIGAYAMELMELAGYSLEEARRIVGNLVYTEKTHGYVIGRDRAIKMGLKVSQQDDEAAILPVMREWLGCYMMESGGTHYVRYVVPRQEDGNAEGPPRQAAGVSRAAGRRGRRHRTDAAASGGG